jgi:hypothetical protein
MLGKAVPAESPAILDERNARWALVQIEEALRGLQFGQVTIVVQDGVVVQVERTDRKRFQRTAPGL